LLKEFGERKKDIVCSTSVLGAGSSVNFLGTGTVMLIFRPSLLFPWMYLNSFLNMPRLFPREVVVAQLDVSAILLSVVFAMFNNAVSVTLGQSNLKHMSL